MHARSANYGKILLFPLQNFMVPLLSGCARSVYYYSLISCSRACLPSTIEPTVAVQTFRSQRGRILPSFRHCLLSLATSLYAESIISQEVYDTACNENKDKNQRCVALLDCVEARVELVPLDFNKVLHILQSEGFLVSLADSLIKTYSEWVLT